MLKRLSCMFTIFTTMKQFSLSILASCTCLSCENCLCLICSNLLLVDYLICWFAHSHMSFHKCWNLALALFTYNDILVYGQYIYICCLSFVWICNCDGGEICIWLCDIDSDIFQRSWNSLIIILSPHVPCLAILLT